MSGEERGTNPQGPPRDGGSSSFRPLHPRHHQRPPHGRGGRGNTRGSGRGTREPRRGVSPYRGYAHGPHDHGSSSQGGPLDYGSSSQGGSRSRGSSSQGQRVWVPTIPQWEKDFCWEVGNTSWIDFVEKKRYSTIMSPRVMSWDDSAGHEAFNNARQRFWATRNRVPVDNIPGPNPDQHIDNVDWDAQDDPVLQEELAQAIAQAEAQAEAEEEEADNQPAQDEPIAPTGWDVDPSEFGPRELTGLIVGDKSEDDKEK